MSSRELSKLNLLTRTPDSDPTQTEIAKIPGTRIKWSFLAHAMRNQHQSFANLINSYTINAGVHQEIDFDVATGILNHRMASIVNAIKDLPTSLVALTPGQTQLTPADLHFGRAMLDYTAYLEIEDSLPVDARLLLLKCLKAFELPSFKLTPKVVQELLGISVETACEYESFDLQLLLQKIIWENSQQFIQVAVNLLLTDKGSEDINVHFQTSEWFVTTMLGFKELENVGQHNVQFAAKPDKVSLKSNGQIEITDYKLDLQFVNNALDNDFDCEHDVLKLKMFMHICAVLNALYPVLNYDFFEFSPSYLQKLFKKAFHAPMDSIPEKMIEQNLISYIFEDFSGVNYTKIEINYDWWIDSLYIARQWFGWYVSNKGLISSSTKRLKKGQFMLV